MAARCGCLGVESRMTTRKPKSAQQKAAEARVKRLLRERDEVGVLAHERLQVKRQRAANARARARTAELRAGRISGLAMHDHDTDTLPFEESA